MSCGAMPTPSKQLVGEIIERTLESVATTDDGNQWAADALRKRGWTVSPPSSVEQGRG